LIYFAINIVVDAAGPCDLSDETLLHLCTAFFFFFLIRKLDFFFLVSTNMQVFHYQGGTSPPADWAQWSTFVTTAVKVMVHRYGATEVRFSLYDFMC
jgi:hypothetical protein